MPTDPNYRRDFSFFAVFKFFSPIDPDRPLLCRHNRKRVSSPPSAGGPPFAHQAHYPIVVPITPSTQFLLNAQDIANLSWAYATLGVLSSPRPVHPPPPLLPPPFPPFRAGTSTGAFPRLPLTKYIHPLYRRSSSTPAGRSPTAPLYVPTND